MKKILVFLLALFILCGCTDGGDDNPEPIENNKPDTTEKEKVTRYFKYLGAEDFRDENNIIIPEAPRYDDIYYNGDGTWEGFLEDFRYAKYLYFDENGNGKHIDVSYEQKDVDNYYEPVFEVIEEEMSMTLEGETVAKVGTSDFYPFYFDKKGRLHMDSKHGFEVYEEVSKSEIDSILNGTREYVSLNNAKVGDEVVFGKYEQDICMSNGPDPIIWQVLAIENGKAFLISKDVIDDHKFNSDDSNTTWADSSLRSFLNNEFYDTVFTDEEKALIETTTVSNSNQYIDYLSNYWMPNSYIKFDLIKSVDNGSDTSDKVFILDLGEVRYYLGEEDGYMPVFMSAENGPKDFEENWKQFGIDLTYGASGRLSRPSEAIIRWSSVAYSTYHQSVTRHYAIYWLRTLGDNQNAALAVTDIGAFMSYDVNARNVGVRPAIWVKLSEASSEPVTDNKPQTLTNNEPVDSAGLPIDLPSLDFDNFDWLNASRPIDATNLNLVSLNDDFKFIIRSENAMTIGVATFHGKSDYPSIEMVPLFYEENGEIKETDGYYPYLDGTSKGDKIEFRSDRLTFDLTDAYTYGNKEYAIGYGEYNGDSVIVGFVRP